MEKVTNIETIITRMCGTDHQVCLECINDFSNFSMIVWSVFDRFELGFDENDVESRRRVYRKAIALHNVIVDYFNDHYTKEELGKDFAHRVKERIFSILNKHWEMMNGKPIRLEDE